MAYDLIALPNATQILNKILLGNCISGFTTGDVWSLHLLEIDYHITFHEMYSKQEDIINQALRNTKENFLDCVDPEGVAWATILASITRQKIISASIEIDSSLNLAFEGDIDLLIKTDTDTVDWYWSIGSEYLDPYTSQAELACFDKGEISRWQ